LIGIRADADSCSPALLDDVEEEVDKEVGGGGEESMVGGVGGK